MTETKFRFFTIADYEDEEIWLRKMHNDGLKLVKVNPPGIYTFEECEPEDTGWISATMKKTRNSSRWRRISAGNLWIR